MIIYKNILKIKLGALTNKPYAFQNRPWDLDYIISTDAYDSLGSSIRIDLYGSEIKRILPLKNDIINEDWISNRTRFYFEGFFKWRVNVPFIKKNNKLIQSSWLECFYYFFLNLWFYSFFFNTNYIGFILDVALDIELLIILKLFSIILGFLIITIDKFNIGEYYLSYLNPNFYENLNKINNFIFLGINLRLESPILNIKLRKKKMKESILYANIGNLFNDNLNSFNLGLNTKNIICLLKGKLKFNIYLLKKLKKNTNNILNLKNKNNIIFILGNNINIQKDTKTIYNYILKSYNNINLINQLHNKYNYYTKYIEILNNKLISKFKIISQNINFNLNIISLNLFWLLYQEIYLEKKNKLKKWWNLNIIYLLNQKNLINNKKNKFFIFQGHHIDLNLLNTNIILPNKIILEKDNFFLDIEGSLLKTNKSTFISGKSKNDWMILNALYLYSLNFFNKIYKFNLQNKKLKFINFNHYYWYIDNKKVIYKYIKKYTINYYFKQLTKKLNNVNKNNLHFVNSNNIIKIYNKIIDNYYYNIYNIYIIDQYSRTMKMSSENFDFYMRNYINIKKKKIK